MRRRKRPQKLAQMQAQLVLPQLKLLQNLLRNLRQKPLPSPLRHLPLMRP